MSSPARETARRLSWLRPYAMGLASVVVALGLTLALWQVTAANPMVFFLVAVAVSSWRGGLKAGLTAMAGSVLMLYLIFAQVAEVVWLGGYDLGRLGLFALASVLLAWFAEGRRQAELALGRSDETFRKLFESASEAVILADQSGRITLANARAERMFGYGRDEMVGRTIETLLPEDRREQHRQHRAAYVAAPRSRSMGAGLDLRARRKDGSEFPVEISLSYVRDRDQVIVMALVTDISERKVTEASLSHYQERLRQLAFESVRTEQRERRRIAVDLHDRLGQALALCQIKLGSLRERADQALSGELDQCIALVEQSVQDTRNLTFELSPPVLYDLGFGPAVQWLSDQMRQEHGFDVQVEGADRPLSLDDELAALLFRSVRELLVNSVKHGQTSRATVRIDADGRQVRIAVADRGQGFDMQRVNQDASAQASFGLFSIREQIERVGGRVEITSQPGKGTEVRLEVPLADADRETMLTKASEA